MRRQFSKWSVDSTFPSTGRSSRQKTSKKNIGRKWHICPADVSGTFLPNAAEYTSFSVERQLLSGIDRMLGHNTRPRALAKTALRAGVCANHKDMGHGTIGVSRPSVPAVNLSWDNILKETHDRCPKLLPAALFTLKRSWEEPDVQQNGNPLVSGRASGGWNDKKFLQVIRKTACRGFYSTE